MLIFVQNFPSVMGNDEDEAIKAAAAATTTRTTKRTTKQKEG